MKEYKGKPVYGHGEFNLRDAKIGDYCNGAVVMDYMDLLPPIRMRPSCAQIGEAYTTRYDESMQMYRDTYNTFRCMRGGKHSAWDDDAVWSYCGDCFAGETIQRGNEPPYITSLTNNTIH